MSEPEDASPLADADSNVPDDVKRMLRACREDVGTPDDVKRLGATLAPLLWPGQAAAPVRGPSEGGMGAQGGVPASAGRILAKKIGTAIVGLGVAGAGVWAVVAHSGRERSPEAPASTAVGMASGVVESAPSVAAPSASAAETAPFAASSATNELTAPAVTAANPEPGAAPGGVAKPSKGGDRAATNSASVSEAELLGQAQAALASNPAEALAVTEEHRRRYPNGALVQEREVIAIEALSRLGRTASAESLAGRFLKAFPKSAYRSKVLALVGDKKPGAPAGDGN